MATYDAVDWHSDIAHDFDKKYTQNPRFLERFAVWTKHIDAYSHPSFRVLDVGCGSGVFSFYAAQKNRAVWGLDGSQEMLKICEEKKPKNHAKNVSFLHGDIAQLEHLVEGPFDLILCSSVLEYLDDLDGTLALFARLLTDQGKILFSLPNGDSVHRKLEPYLYRLTGRPRYYRHVRHVLTLSQLQQRLRQQHLQLLQHDYFAQLPVLSRYARCLGAQRYTEMLYLVVVQKSHPTPASPQTP